MTRSSRPANRVWRLATSCGSNVPARSRGVRTSTGPRSVLTVGGRAVAHVARPSRGCLPRRIPEVAGQLGAQRALKHPAGELAHQPARTGDLLRDQPFERVLERLLGQQARETFPKFLNRTLVSGRPRRPPLTELDLL